MIRAAEDVPDSMKSSDEDDDKINEVTAWKKTVLEIMKSSDEESSDEEIQTVCKQPYESISVPASPTPEEVEEPKSPSSQLNSPESSEFESDSPCTSPTPSDTDPVTRHTQRTTKAQIQTLVDCMALNPSMGFGPQDSNIADWRRLTDLLSTMGPRKKVVGWQKTWHNMKLRAKKAARKKSRMKDGVPLSLMKQKVIEIMVAYKEKSNALDESIVEFDELPCPTEGMPVLFARSLSPPSRLNSLDLDNIGDLDNSIDFQDIGLNPEMSTLGLDGDTSLGKGSPSRGSGQMSPLRYDSDQSSDGESPGRRIDEVSNEQSSSTQVLKQITRSVTSGTAGKRDSNGSFLPKTKRKIVTHEKEIFQKVQNIISETPNSQDNSTKMDTDCREEIMSDDMSLPRRSARERNNSYEVSPSKRKSGQMSSERHNSGQMSPVRRKSDQTSPERRNSGQTSPERRNSDQIPPERRNSGQTSPERRNSDQISPERRNSGQRPTQRLVIPVRCYTSQVSSQGSEQMSPMLNSKDLLENVEGRASPTESDAELEKLAMLKGSRKRRCIIPQTAFLVSFMKENVDFAMKVDYTPAGCEKWRRLSKKLNKLGPSKSVQSWRTTWRDFKRNALLRKNNNPLEFLPHWIKVILEIMEAHKNQATTSDETASMNGENRLLDSSQQSRKTSELVENARCSKAQIAALVDYMTVNPALAKSEYKGPCADDPTIEGWRQLSKNLNSMGVARSTTGWKQIWRNIVTCVRNSQQPNDWDEKISRKVLKAVGDETIVKNHTELTIDIVEETGHLSPVHNFNQMSPPYNIGQESPVNFDQMSPMHSTGQVTLQSLVNTSQATVNFGQLSPVHNNRQCPVNTGQMSLGRNNCQVGSSQAGVNEISVESYIQVDPPLYSKHKRMQLKRATRAQVKAIVNYMSTHPALARGDQRGPIAVGKRQLEWRRLGKHLNRLGPTKSTDAWKHTWRDLKRSARTAKNSQGFQAQIYQQILNIMSPANDGPIEASIDAVEENDTLPTSPAENISIPFPRSPSPELCLNAPDPLQCNDEPNDISRHKNSRGHSQQIPSVGQSNNVSTRHKDSDKFSQQMSSLGQSNNITTRLQDSRKHGLQISSFSDFVSILRNSVHSNHVSTRKENDSQTNEQMSLPPSQTKNVSPYKEPRHSHQTPVPRTSGESNVSTKFKESEKDNLQMSSPQRSSDQSYNNQLSGHIETNDWVGSARERRAERSTQTRKQLNSLVDYVYAHPILASEQKTSKTRHQEWRYIGKFLNKMGPIYCTDWKNRWKELKYDVDRRWKKDGAYTGCIDSVRVKKVLELIAKYPTADRTDSEIEIVEEMPTQAPTAHHPTSSVQHKVVEILSRNHTVDRGSINARSEEIIASSNGENRTAGRDSIERSKEEGEQASSTTATSNISSGETNSLLKDLIGELRRSNELKVEQNGILKQLVKQFSTDALKTNHSKKKEAQTEHVVPPVEQKREVEDEDLTEENSSNMRNLERSEEHYAHTSIQDGPSHKDKVHITSVRNSVKSEKPQIPIFSKEDATPSPNKQIRVADITRLMEPTFKPIEPIKHVVKVKTITKAPMMPRVSLLRLKDGTMMVMPGTKLPASNDEYQTFVVGSVQQVEGEKVPENENEPAGFEEYEF